MMPLALLLVIVLPASSALFAALGGSARSRTKARVGVAATTSAAVIAAGLAVTVYTDGPVSAVTGNGDAVPALGLVADALTVSVLLLVTGVSAVVQAFARRYLHADAAASRFFAWAGTLTAASAAMAASATLVGLAFAWTLSGVALIALLRLYPGATGARSGARLAIRAFLIGDGALWLAVAVATFQWGNLDLRTLGAVAPGLVADDPEIVAVVACLLVVAALARSAQVPLQSWLPATLAAPTPVSALLHAGVVNAGGILLIRLSPVFGASALATHMAFIAGGATVIYGTSLMLTKPDVKGALAHSTMGQMGFMVMTCGLGAFAAAAFHLLAHGMFKATLFLGSGSAIAQHARGAKAPPRPKLGRRGSIAALAGSAALSAGVLGAAIAILDRSESLGGTQALLLFAWTTSSAMVWGWIRSCPTPGGWSLAAAATSIALPLYVIALAAAKDALAPALVGAGTSTASPWLLVGIASTVGLLTVLRSRPVGGGLARVQRAVYVAALNAGTVSPEFPAGPHRAALRPIQTRLIASTESAGRS